ncbi:hypothetical protein OX283_004820 [Flavobacterium sp. SUN052]|uniref:hypothetical protein n=1 Tax=Flavobacterium sp. SUN052 TaxID=3002441 RepID=UPI00237DC661|nr:hypothetical protein [Flavobacterium sp. SUN052]MEC4003969.1 hypothetical protein [Flavobacterium sp. SUN052]
MEKNLTNIKERVLIFCKYKGLSIEPFLESIGMTYGSFKGKAKKGSLNSDAIANIYTNFSDLNLEWLLTGNGDMIKPSFENNLKISKKSIKENLNSPNDLLIESLKETIESQKTTISALQMTINMFKESNYIDSPLNESKNRTLIENIEKDGIAQANKMLKK